MAPATAQKLEVSVLAIQKMCSDVLKELKKEQKPATKKQSKVADMHAEIKWQMAKRRANRSPTK